MRRVATFFSARWMTSLLGALVLCLLVWFFGPAIGIGSAHPLDSEIARVITMAIIMVAWAILLLLHELRSRKKEKALVEGVTSGPEPEAQASAEEIAVLRDRLRDALKQLKRSGIGGRFGRHLYQLPWYMFIGPPGAGKTTALVNSGLKFPLAEKDRAPVAGVGGTRNCDWWFTDQAVLIDTAGRYTTQDSQASVDASAWLGFLRLLKKTRARQPLNGVIVAISLVELATSTDAQRAAHAAAIRRRLRELHDELGVRLPVYVMFTKTDLLAGFVEFFDPLGREEREQVWGMTFPRDDGATDAKAGEGGAVAGFGKEFDLLLDRLNDRMLERLQQETDLPRRRLIYGFPQQFATFRDTAGDFLTEIFRPSRLEAKPLLRGVYFTSGTQDGTPIDRLLGTLAGQFGLQRDAVTAFSGQGRSYFLTRLVREVIFGEAGLVRLDPAVERRRTWNARLVYAACAAILLTLTAAWAGSYIGNTALIGHVHTDSLHYQQEYEALAKRGPADTDLQAALPALDAARNITKGYTDQADNVPFALAFGLYQGHKLHEAATTAYYRALDAILLPRLLARLEEQMSANMGKPAFLYEALQVYLILGRQGPADPALVHQWMEADFDASFPGDENEPTRDSLLQHVDAMLEQPPPPLKLNGPLVASVRDVLNREPLAEYSYNRMMKSASVLALPEWTIADNMGPGGDRVFSLRSGKPLSTGVPGIFTYAGYHATFLKRLPLVAQDVASDAWVLGRENKGVTATLAEAAKLRRDVLGLYLDDYVKRWDDIIGDIAIKPFSNLSDSVDMLKLLSAPDSPLRDMLEAIDQQTQLSRAANGEAALGKAGSKGTKVASKLAGFGKFEATKGLSLEQQDLANILGEGFGTSASGKPIDPAERVDQHFRWLHDFVAGDADHPTPPLETALQKMGTLAAGLGAAANAANPGQASLAALAGGGGGTAGASADLKSIAKDVPGPIAAILTTVSQGSSSLAERGASNALQDAWRSKVLPLCNEAFGRYPFVAGSSADVPADDFARLLGPNGLIDSFFNENLKPFVDTGSTPWRWQATDHASLGLSPGTLTQFERAAMIRDSLFASGGAMQVRFTLLPVSLDARLAKATVDIAGQSMTYDHGPIELTAFQWPGASGNTLVRITLVPVSGGGGITIEKDGPWALLRLMDAGRVIRSGQPDRFRLIFSSPQGDVEYQLTASSVRNPFTMSALRSFRCPAHL